MPVTPTETAALHFRTARDILDKVRRERSRYADALDRKDETAAADYLFNLAVTVLSVRDWIRETAPDHAGAAFALETGNQAIARLVDSANLGKHRKLKKDPKSNPEITEQSFVLSASRSPNPSGEVVYENVLKSKAKLKGGSVVSHLDDADKAIAAWVKFMEDRGL